MEHTTHLGIVALPGAINRVPLSISLHVGPRQTTAPTLAGAATLGRPEYTAISVVGEINGHTVDLGVRADVDVRDLPTTIEDLAVTEPVAGLIAAFGHRLADLTWYLTVFGLAYDDRIVAGFTVADIEFLQHCLINVQQRWQEGVDAANNGAARPRSDNRVRPGSINIEPTAHGYQSITRLAEGELARVRDYGKRLGKLLDLARETVDADEESQ